MFQAGDYNTTETVVIPFNTFSSDDPAASVTVTNLVAGDVEIHKDGGATQRASDNGVTVNIDFDTVTGNHTIAIDLSDNSDAGFYASGSRYQVRVEGTTIDGGTVNAWVGCFSIGCVLRPTTAGRTLDVTSGGCAGIDWANIESPTTTVDLAGTDIQLCDTVTTNTDMRGTDNAALADKLLAYVQLLARKDAAIKTDRATELADINANQGSGVGAFNNQTASLERAYDSLVDTDELQTLWTVGGAARTQLALLQNATYGLDKLARTGADGDTLETLSDQIDGVPTTTEMDDAFTEIKGAGFTTTDTLEAIRNQGDAAWATATSVTVSDKTGFKLAADGLDSITATEPTGKPTTFPGWIMWLIQRFRRATKSTTAITTLTEAGATVTTQIITDDGAGNETLGPPS